MKALGMLGWDAPWERILFLEAVLEETGNQAWRAAHCSHDARRSWMFGSKTAFRSVSADSQSLRTTQYCASIT